MGLPAFSNTTLEPAGPALSANGQRWEFPSPAIRRQAAVLQQSLGLPAAVAGILAQRNLTDPATVAAWLNPRLEQLPDPASLRDMDRALAVLIPAIEARLPFCIFGDYDVDGTCATTMLTRYLSALNVPVQRYIPDRLSEGYGPNVAAMQTIHARGARVLLTVDTGTNAPEALAAAKALGLQVIVTDHHPPQGPLPAVAALLNPHRPDDVSNLGMLCGSGVAFFMLMALNRALRLQGFFSERQPEPRLLAMLDLVALATVADLMPLVGANRVLVAKGLQQLATGQNVGLAALAQVAGAGHEPSTYTLGFVLGPRLNAAGRIDNAEAAMQLLLAEIPEAAWPLAQQLHDLNAARQALEKTIVAEALGQATVQLEQTEVLAPILHAPHWHPGVVGIVASRIKDKTGRPCFVLGTDDNGSLKGSGRSAAGLDLGAALQQAAGTYKTGGGHAAAAGVTLQAEQLPAFREAINQALWAQLQARPTAQLPLPEQLAGTLVLAASLSPAALAGEAGLKLAEALQALAPFGMGNPDPIFWLPQVVVASVRPVGADSSHYRLRLTAPTGGAACEAMAFGAANTPLGDLLNGRQGRPLDIAVTIKQRTFNGKLLLDVVVKDARA